MKTLEQIDYLRKQLGIRDSQVLNDLLNSYDNAQVSLQNQLVKLQQKINKLEREIKIKDAWANEIKCNLWGYDGYENSIPGLKGLVDEAIDKSEKIMSCDDKSIVMCGLRYDKNGNRYSEYKNVLDEVLTEFTEKDQKIINLCNKDLRGDNDKR